MLFALSEVMETFRGRLPTCQRLQRTASESLQKERILCFLVPKAELLLARFLEMQSEVTSVRKMPVSV